MNKKGNMFTDNTIYVLGSLFGLGILSLLIINPILKGYLKPGLLNTASPSVVATIEPGIDFVITMVTSVPYILFFIAIIYLLVIIFRKEEVQQ